MALSPQYSWPEPDNSSLVKNGAQDIRALGDAIDTSVWNVGYGQSGKNKIINGDFKINQRAFTSTTTNETYGFDRFVVTAFEGTTTYSAQTFTTGAAPVAGYEAANFARIVTTGQTATSSRSTLAQRIEDVRTFAGNTVTVSFWAKAATGTPSVCAEFSQVFGTGGSPSTTVTEIIASPAKQAITTSWARYSFTIAVPSISGKTIGTTTSGSLSLNLWVSAGSDFAARTGSLGIQSNTFDFWGVQVEYGSKATPFQTATGTIQGELAACQRYYYRFTTPAVNKHFGTGQCYASTASLIFTKFPITMRTSPTALEQSGTASHYAVLGATTNAITASVVPAFDQATPEAATTLITVSSGLVAGNITFLQSNNASAYLGWSAEL